MAIALWNWRVPRHFRCSIPVCVCVCVILYDKRLTRVSELGDIWMNGDALGVVGHVAGGARAEQPLVGRPPEVVEAAEVADVGRAASRVGAVPAHGGGGM